MDVTHDIDHVIRHHQSLVRSCLRRFGVQERDLPDATQDVFIVVHRRLPTFEGRSRLSTWIYRIAFHVASEHRRRACNRREVLVDVEATTAIDDERRDTIEQVTRALSQLDPDRRDVLVDFELDEQPMSVIAARLGVPLKTAFSRLYAARRDLGRRLREVGLGIFLPPWWTRRSQPAPSLVTTLAAVMLLVPDFGAQPTHTDAVVHAVAIEPVADAGSAITTQVEEHVVTPNAERPTLPARRARAVVTAPSTTTPPADDVVAEELIVFHDSEAEPTPRVPPPLLAQLPPAPAAEPRIQLRGVRDANWRLVTPR